MYVCGIYVHLCVSDLISPQLTVTNSFLIIAGSYFNLSDTITAGGSSFGTNSF